jgi:hypothetical protein
MLVIAAAFLLLFICPGIDLAGRTEMERNSRRSMAACDGTINRMPHDALLLVLLALPFAGSITAGIFPANARNSEALLAGGHRSILKAT